MESCEKNVNRGANEMADKFEQTPNLGISHEVVWLSLEL